MNHIDTNDMTSNSTNDTDGGSTTRDGDRMSQRVGSPLSNEAYNVITALQAKLEGLEAYRKYSRDGGTSIWAAMSRTDTECVEKLVDELEQMMRDGKLRSSQTGQTRSS